MGIYIWTLGEKATAKIAKTVFERVCIVKNEDGLFYDDKVLGITEKEDGSVEAIKELCYFVEICRTKETLWLPYTSLELTERSRPFYGPADKSNENEDKDKGVIKKRKPKNEIVLPLCTPKQNKIITDENVHHEVLHLPDQSADESECDDQSVDQSDEQVEQYSDDEEELLVKGMVLNNPFQDFMRRGTDAFLDWLCRNKYSTKLNLNDPDQPVELTSEDIFKILINNITTIKEINGYLQNCWRYYNIQEMENENDQKEDNLNPHIPIHTDWCIVCGKRDDLSLCCKCPAAYHFECIEHWVLTILHRKTPPDQITQIMKEESTKRMRNKKKDIIKTNEEQCPSCEYGPTVSFGDVVWNKLTNTPWWPAQVLNPGSLPMCLTAREHEPRHWPIKFYGDDKFAWVEPVRTCMFLPSHVAVLSENRTEELKDAVMDACDDYIGIYLA